ncbi:isoaspartyl peptidase/L-asparaginase family protein [Thermaurantiacus tibetensis]|uniref:isoaspartyl peptidase/L-asparaginase family protein n=1 Tax=Thermaurantiacus tibetensis TaxID=2759035 RepID=UPI00188FEE87|nr:isoaspartyl peptidase/L-asparaginase [Thermaurantiacus tibetensis]
MARTLVAAVAALVALMPARAGEWALALHGGAGVIERGRFAPGEEEAIRQALGRALERGRAILASGGTAVDAVEAVVVALEAAPQFNAGVGAALTSAGTTELDAAIMDGATRRAAAVTGVMTTESPVRLARKLMETGPHVFLAGAAADAFARAHGLPQVENGHFITPARRRMLEEIQKGGASAAFDLTLRFGTVGAVARDQAGNLAAATSTGGLTGKAPGRIGDSPIIGAGTVAENGACAVSATGSGEIFIRARAAGQICDRIRFGGQSAEAAANAVIADIGSLGGDGGVIVVDANGEVVFAMNAPGMYRAAVTSRSAPVVHIYADE